MKRGKKQRLVIVGNGMAGAACLEQILRHEHRFDITVFGDETHVNYNRILLSSVLAGEKETDEIILNPIEWYVQNRIGLRLGIRINAIDTRRKRVIGEDGSSTPYDKVILATGSSPFIPKIEGVDKKSVCTFRNLDDTRRLAEWSAAGRKAVVIGGGLLGLEAARGLQLRGCNVTVVHLMDRLMERQLDPIGALYLKKKIEELGIRVLLERQTTSLLGNGRVEGLRFACGEMLEADFVVIAAGIRPNTELAAGAGIHVRRGIVVNDYLETSEPGVYAVGECTEHRGVTYGLVAPLLQQGKVLAAAITGNETAPFDGSVPAAKLKIAGVDVFSAGEYEDRPGADSIRYEDPWLGVYKKLVLRNNKLVGFVLVGDISSNHRYLEWLRSGDDLATQRQALLYPEPAADAGQAAAMLSDQDTVCGCLGVTKGAIIQAIHEKGICTLAQVKETTRASTGCGSCAGLCQDILRAVAPKFEEEAKKGLCRCLPFPEEQIRQIVQTQKLRSVQDVLEIYGNGKGCEVCKPALSYMLDMLWCGGHEEDRSARFINDRVHANIQRDGTFSVVPRIRGGVTSPAELRRIADVAEKYAVPMVKITGSQRIDLLGVKKQDLPAIWADLGMPSGQAYTKGVRMVKTCVGSDFCRFGTQNSIATGIELERRLENLFTPHKTKMAVVGCPRNCAEATVKDIGLVGQEGSWQVVVGGAAGKIVRKADLLITVESTDEALRAAELFFQYYRENANYLERTYDFVERLGIEKIRRETVYAQEPVQAGLLDRLKKSKVLSRDAWLERDEPRTASQFVPLTAIEGAAAPP
jgi:nitrite reductase (NADH) large subunit